MNKGVLAQRALERKTEDGGRRTEAVEAPKPQAGRKPRKPKKTAEKITK